MEVDEQRTYAIEYVQRQGSVLQRARIEALAFDTPPCTAAIAALLANRNPDDGWHGGADYLPLDSPLTPPSSLSHTLRALRYAWELGMGRTGSVRIEPAVRMGLHWVRRQQHSDGSFADDDSILSGGLRMVRLSREDERTVAFLTASALHTMDTWFVGVPGMEAVGERAFIWLRTNVRSWQGQHPRTDWLAAAAALRRERTTDSESVLRPLAQLALHQSVHPRELTAMALAEMVTTLTDAGWPLKESPLGWVMMQLLRLQRADGAFAQEGEDAVEATIASVRAMAKVGHLAKVC